MKKATIAFLLLTGAVLGTAAQDKDKKKIDVADIPAAVISTFNSTFPNSSDVEWKRKNNHYLVSFDMNNTDHHAKIDQTGRLVSRGMEIPASQLPETVTTAIKRDYPDYKIDDAFTVVENGKTTYKVSFEDREDRKITYDASGIRIKE